MARRRAHEPYLEPDPRRPHRYPEIRDWLLAMGAERPVFFKDMSYYVLDQLAAGPGFLRALRSTFIIRDPARAIASCCRINPAPSDEEIGIEQLHRHFLLVRELAPEQSPVVIDADDLLDDPPGMLRARRSALRGPACRAPGPARRAW